MGKVMLLKLLRNLLPTRVKNVKNIKMEIQLEKKDILKQIYDCNQYLDADFFFDAILMGTNNYDDEVEIFLKLYERLFELELIDQNTLKNLENE